MRRKKGTHKTLCSTTTSTVTTHGGHGRRRLPLKGRARFMLRVFLPVPPRFRILSKAFLINGSFSISTRRSLTHWLVSVLDTKISRSCALVLRFCRTISEAATCESLSDRIARPLALRVLDKLALIPLRPRPCFNKEDSWIKARNCNFTKMLPGKIKTYPILLLDKQKRKSIETKSEWKKGRKLTMIGKPRSQKWWNKNPVIRHPKKGERNKNRPLLLDDFSIRLKLRRGEGSSVFFLFLYQRLRSEEIEADEHIYPLSKTFNRALDRTIIINIYIT